MDPYAQLARSDGDEDASGPPVFGGKPGKFAAAGSRTFSASGAIPRRRPLLLAGAGAVPAGGPPPPRVGDRRGRTAKIAAAPAGLTLRRPLARPAGRPIARIALPGDRRGAAAAPRGGRRLVYNLRTGHVAPLAGLGAGLTEEQERQLEAYLLRMAQEQASSRIGLPMTQEDVCPSEMPAECQGTIADIPVGALGRVWTQRTTFERQANEPWDRYMVEVAAAFRMIEMLLYQTKLELARMQDSASTTWSTMDPVRDAAARIRLDDAMSTIRVSRAIVECLHRQFWLVKCNYHSVVTDGRRFVIARTSELMRAIGGDPSQLQRVEQYQLGFLPYVIAGVVALGLIVVGVVGYEGFSALKVHELQEPKMLDALIRKMQAEGSRDYQEGMLQASRDRAAAGDQDGAQRYAAMAQNELRAAGDFAIQAERTRSTGEAQVAAAESEMSFKEAALYVFLGFAALKAIEKI